jgi:hypothetical protein
MFCVLAVNRKTGTMVFFGPYETEVAAGAFVNAGRRRGGKVSWWPEPLRAPAEGGDPHGVFMVHISGHRYVLMVDASGPQLTGPFSTSVAARAWMRKNKIDGSHGHVATLILNIDEAAANQLWLPTRSRRRVWV